VSNLSILSMLAISAKRYLEIALITQYIHDNVPFGTCYIDGKKSFNFECVGGLGDQSPDLHADQ
jgi:hypothetical protein